VLAVAIIVIAALAIVAVVVTAGRMTGRIGGLSRETVARDRAATAATATTPPGTDLEAIESTEAQQRAEEARARATSGAPVPRDAGAVTEWQPMDPEELSVTRRQFFNRAILTVGGLAALPGLGAAVLAFLWPSGVGGFGGKVTTKLSAASGSWATKQPFYVPDARTYLQPYPTDSATLAAAKKVYDPAILDGMSKGVVALYQKCVHLGCKVPWCQSAQWFECPCHGSKYNRVGEKRDGPAPRGLDRFAVDIQGDAVTINTSTVYTGPPIGTDTTKQSAEGPHCV
jgi:cytochrome b6-f complex iron-sulfur subunit